MTARKPKSAKELATKYANTRWSDERALPHVVEIHLAGQRTGSARARKEAREKLQALLGEKLAQLKEQPHGYGHYEEAFGIRLAAAALNIKLENV